MSDGYSATMAMKFLDAPTSGTGGLFYGICVSPIGDSTSEDNYLKDPRAMCLGINTTCSIDGAGNSSTAIVNDHYGTNGLMAGWFGYSNFSDLEASVAQSTVVPISGATTTTAILCQAKVASG